MERDEIITGLKAGRTLMLDGAATESERQIIADLQDEGLVSVDFVDGDQYGAFRIRWKHPTKQENEG